MVLWDRRGGLARIGTFVFAHGPLNENGDEYGKSGVYMNIDSYNEEFVTMRAPLPEPEQQAAE